MINHNKTTYLKPEPNRIKNSWVSYEPFRLVLPTIYLAGNQRNFYNVFAVAHFITG